MQKQRLDLNDVIDRLAADGKLPPGASPQQVADTLWLLTDFQLFRMLVKDRG